MQKILVNFVKPVVIFTFFMLASVVNFGSNLRSEFMIDDVALITDQTSVKSPQLSNFYQHFIPDYKIREKIEDAPPAAYYRPIAHIIPFLQSLMFGVDPYGYRFTNIVLFSLACLSFYFLLFVLSGDRRLAFLAATLFCLHPINGLMVNYITASVYAAQLIFLSLCMVLALGNSLTLALGMFVLALLCHETSLMLPAYLFLMWWHRQRNVGEVLKKVLPFIIVAVIYLGMRFYFVSIEHTLLAKSGFYSNLNALNYCATFTKLLAWYFTKLITLQSPVIIWSTPLVREGMSLWLAGGIAAIGVAVYFIRQWKDNIKAVYVLWFFLGLAPMTFGSLFLPKTGMMIEPHWLFFASFGLFALAAVIVLQVADKLTKRLRMLWFVALGVFLIFASWNNNELWKDELTFTRHWVAEAPTNKNAAFCYANALLKRGRLSEAKDWFLNSLMGDHNDWQNYNNLAEIALRENDEAQALEYYQAALAVFPQSATVHNNLGTYYLKKAERDKAEGYLRQAHVLNPYQPESLLNMGLLLEAQNRWDEAWKNYLMAYDLRPKDERVLAVLLRTALKGHGHEEINARAEEFLQEIRSEDLLNELGGLLAVHGRYPLSLQYFTKAIALYPRGTTAYSESGKVLANTGYFEQAEKMWNEGLRIDPADQELKELLRELAALKAQFKN
ncbi:MAG: tetratricopeptide repeat protein [Candidatus Omnitrophica bacterium]|nr:tetratricopeptide repeat protein [Candidatus Omnitrophota bacterium]